MCSVFDQSVRKLKGVGPKRSQLLLSLGLEKVRDLLFFCPYRYENRTLVHSISDLVPGRPAAVVASFVSFKRKRILCRQLEILECVFRDDSGSLTVTWFNRRGLELTLKKAGRAVLFGIPELRGRSLAMTTPFAEPLAEGESAENFCGITPVYPSTEGLPKRWFARLVSDVLTEYAPQLEETLPLHIIEKRRLLSIKEAVWNIHKPKTWELQANARKRLAYEELLMLQLALAMKRCAVKTGRPAPRLAPGEKYKKFLQDLPFEPTGAQLGALDDIIADVSKSEPMMRLLQGDVGSGKTLAALGLAVVCADSGRQCAIMAPTEVLAEQLFKQCESFLSPLGIKTVFLSGSLPSSERRNVLLSVKRGEAAVVTGTHALIAQDLRYKDLGATVVDEQHRFGVFQRAALSKESHVPHMLMMSATPIPRTLALCVFGDLDITVLREKPKNRIPVATRIIDFHSMGRLLQFIIDEAAAGGKIYWVCPRIDEAGASGLISAEARHAFLQKHLGRIGVGLLHGRMDIEEKNSVLAKLSSGGIKILVATTIIEVGIDVPDATVIVVESPERFGLSQLHQLRGRVGRGQRRGVCVLLVRDGKNFPERLRVLTKTDDGFEIAEADAEMRGTGEMCGTAQHGLTGFKIADPIRDNELFLEAREDARKWVGLDPFLERSPAARERAERFLRGTAGMG